MENKNFKRYKKFVFNEKIERRIENYHKKDKDNK